MPKSHWNPERVFEDDVDTGLIRWAFLQLCAGHYSRAAGRHVWNTMQQAYSFYPKATYELRRLQGLRKEVKDGTNYAERIDQAIEWVKEMRKEYGRH